MQPTPADPDLDTKVREITRRQVEELSSAADRIQGRLDATSPLSLGLEITRDDAIQALAALRVLADQIRPAA